MAHTDSQVSEADSPASNSPEKATLIGTLVHLWPYIWPGDRTDLKMRVVWSMVLLLVAKLATLSVPFTFKWAIDALNGTGSAPVEPSNWTLWLIASPLLMTAQYSPVPSSSYPALDAILNSKPTMQTGTSVPSSHCTVGKDLYLNTVTSSL